MFCKNKRAQYPHLSVTAVEIVGIGTISAEVERIFSSAKLTVTGRRCALKQVIIEACASLGH